MASAAEPILASTLWTSHASASEENDISELPRKRRRVGTSLASIDSALCGGLEYAQIACISGPTEARASNLVFAILATHLISDSGATATVVDSTLAFDTRKLHGMLVQRLQAQGGDAANAMKALERLKIMKVFDFIGLTEAVDEVCDGLNKGRQRSEARTHVAPPVQPPPPKGTISDSEGEEEETLDSSTPAQAPAETASERDSSKPRSTMLIIDSISHLTLPLMKNNHSQAQSLLVSLLRSLSHLTTSNDLCTILVNGVHFHGTSQQAKGDPPSIFSSCALRPALGPGLGSMLDLHLLVHEIPTSAEGARRVYGGSAIPRGGQQVELGNVVEVLQDRYGGRAGRWSAFTCAEDGELFTCM